MISMPGIDVEQMVYDRHPEWNDDDRAFFAERLGIVCECNVSVHNPSMKQLVMAERCTTEWRRQHAPKGPLTRLAADGACATETELWQGKAAGEPAALADAVNAE